MKGKDCGSPKLPKKDVNGQGSKMLPKGATKGPDKSTKPSFKTGKSG